MGALSVTMSSEAKRIVWPVFGAFVVCCLATLLFGMLSIYFFYSFYDLLDPISLFYGFGFMLFAYVASYAVYHFVKNRLWLSSRSRQERDKIKGLSERVRRKI